MSALRSPRSRRSKFPESREDKLFRQRLEREFEEFGSPEGSLKARAQQRDLEADRALVKKRLSEHARRRRRATVRSKEQIEEDRLKRERDSEANLKNVRDTQMRINLTKELVEKVAILLMICSLCTVFPTGGQVIS